MTRFDDKWARFLDPQPAKVQPRYLRNGVALLAILALVGFLSVTGDIPLFRGEPGDPVRAQFASANEVKDGTIVRVKGVDVGSVQKVEPGSDPLRSSLVTLRITDDDVRVRRDARATIRWKTLLGGNVYIDLDPGSADAPELADATIPQTRTSTQVETDQALQPYRGRTDDKLRGVIKGTKEGFGDPEGVGRTIERLRALRTVGRGMEALRGRTRDDVRRLVSSAERTLAALGSNDAEIAELKGLVDGAQRTLQATAQRRADLGAMLAQAPATLDAMDVTMTRLRTTLDHLDPLAARLRPGARALAPAARAVTPALGQVDAVLAEARPLLRDLSPTLASLDRASDTGVPLLRALSPVVDRLAADTIPWLYDRDDEISLRVYETLGPFFSTLDQGEYDAYGHRFRLSIPVGTNSVATLPELKASKRKRSGKGSG